MTEREDLEREIRKLEQENRTLGLRVQGVDVLGKILQESQEENQKLREENMGLKQGLKEAGVDISLISTCSSPAASVQPSATNRCFLSKCKDTSESGPYRSMAYEPFEVVPKLPSVSLSSHGFESEGNFSLHGPPGLEFHIKDISTGVKTIKDQSEQLLEQANEMYRAILPSITNPQERLRFKQKIEAYRAKLSQRLHDVNTREKLLQGLEVEEENLKKKVIQMESEQVSQEKVVADLKVELQEYAEELQDIQNDFKLFGEAEMINKEDISLSRISSRASSISTASTVTSQGLTPTKNAGQSKLVSEVTLSKSSCEKCLAMTQQLDKEVKLRKDAERQKEEILDVNHAWDVQYKKLKEEMTNKVKDLKQQVEFYKTSETQKKYEAVKNSYKKVIDDERKKKEDALEDKRRLEEKVKELEEEVKRLSHQIKAQQMQPGAGLLHSYQSTPLSSLAAQAGESSDMVKEVEVLKEQLRIYADDFQTERQDRERMQGEKDTLEAKLKESEEKIDVLEQQVRLYEEDFRKETQEKDRLRQQLVRSTRENNAGKESRIGDFSRQAQALAERQARMRALREEYEIEERRLRQEELDLRRQGGRVMALHPEAELQHTRQHYPSDRYQLRYDRGSMRARGPSARFYGEDVEADTRGMGREVPDGPAQGVISCPHCQRTFSDQNFQAFDDHLNKCIE